nr:chromosome segregation ATPase [Candidatus Enterovibrio escacola]
MVSIQKLSQSIQHSPNARCKKNDNVSRSVGIPKRSLVGTVRSASTRKLSFVEETHHLIQYYLPDGRSRFALASYMDVKNQAKREQLTILLGVDVFA